MGAWPGQTGPGPRPRLGPSPGQTGPGPGPGPGHVFRGQFSVFLAEENIEVKTSRWHLSLMSDEDYWWGLLMIDSCCSKVLAHSGNSVPVLQSVWYYYYYRVIYYIYNSCVTAGGAHLHTLYLYFTFFSLTPYVINWSCFICKVTQAVR